MNAQTKQKQLDYYYAHREERKKKMLEWYEKNRENELLRMKKWSEENREKRTEYHKKYRQTTNGKLNTLKAIKKYEINHPDRRNAWNKAQKLKNKPCIKCGEKAHKHHPNTSKPLEIIYLCPLHHKEEHSKLKII